MKRISILLLALSFFEPRYIRAAQVNLGPHNFTIPDGFEIELVTDPSLVKRPIVADFDEQGRLYVADSAGVNDKVEKQLQEKPHRIVRLEDTDGDGRFDRSTVFADKLMFPEGVLWFNGAIYCGAPPSIWKLEDTDGDGVADRRSEWFEGKTLTGCANDLHGPYLGPDGWIYWAKGAFAKQTHERPGLPTISDSAAHIFRARPDGTGFDSLMSGGMDNPVEVAFTKSGDAIFTTTFYVNPEAGKRDALVHAVYGSVFPKVHGVLDGLKRTGDLMPAMTHLGPAAPCGLTRYRSKVFGDDFEDNLFSTQFNLHRVQRHVLQPMGASYKTRDIDFVVSDNPDFHPTHVIEDADGSLLIFDTGGWYKLCCPTSQLAKPDVLGAIYRVRRKGAPRINDPRGLKLDWKSPSATLVRWLDDPRPAVRDRAIAELAARAGEATPALTGVLANSRSVEARRNALWTLTRISSADARAAVRPALADRDASIQIAAAHSAGLHRDAEAYPALISLLSAGDEPTRREAATALGRIGNVKAVPALLATISRPHDRFLEHSLVYALIELDDRTATLAGLKSPSAECQRAALIALDQMDHGKLEADAVLPLLNSTNRLLKQTANWIIDHRRQWAPELASFFHQRLNYVGTTAEDRTELQSQLSQFVREKPIQDVITAGLTNPSPEVRILLLHVIAQAPGKGAPTEWTAQVRAAIEDEDNKVASAAIEAARSISGTDSNSSAFSSALFAVAKNPRRPEELRLEALAALPAGSALDESLFEFTRARLASKYAPLRRITAATVLGSATLTESQLTALITDLPKVGPLELTRLLPAFASHPTKEIGLELIASLKRSKALNPLAAEALRTRLPKFPPDIQKQGDDLLQSLVTNAPEKKRHLDEIQISLSSGDFRRGQSIFNGTKAACATCHAVGYLGGQLGPDLTRIGSIRTERDLLEAIVYPSASFVRGFEPMTVATKSGDEFSGLVRRETSDSLVVVSGPTAEQRLARADIAEMRPGTVSVMPEGLDQQLTKQELADLVSFLKALK